MVHLDDRSNRWAGNHDGEDDDNVDEDDDDDDNDDWYSVNYTAWDILVRSEGRIDWQKDSS